MSCTNNINTNCGCENNPCGCKTSTNDVVYQGPSLDCIGVVNCDTLTSVFESIDSFICGPGMVQTIINNITNNISLYNQFTTIVNNTVDCNTVWGCETTTSTTTAIPTTTTTTTAVECKDFILEATGPTGSPGDLDWSALDCYTSEPVGGTIVYPDVIRTGCVIASSLVIGSKVINFATTPCITTTTTTTLPI